MISTVAAGTRRWRGIAAVALLALVVWLAAPYVASTAFLLDLAGRDGWARRVLPVRSADVTTDDLLIPTRHGPVAARFYRPMGGADRTLIVFPGIHAGGLDEPRLVLFSTRLAATGALVLSVPLPDLRAFRITVRSTDIVEDAAVWLAADAVRSPAGRVGLIGVSFGGGLALVAAGRPSLEGRLTAVVSIGGHGDLPRVMTYLCTGRLPDGHVQPPHDYGVAVIALAAARELVPADQVESFSAAVTTFLEASSATSHDAGLAQRLFDGARRQAEALPEPARLLAGWVNDRDVVQLGPRLLPFVEALGGHPALSPARSPAPTAPVFLLHGEDDSVIPAIESHLLGEVLAAGGHPRVRVLTTPLLRHAELTWDVGPAPVWSLMRFWTDVRRTTAR